MSVSDPQTLRLGFSPCPNDTFIFHALLHGGVPAPLPLQPHIADVEELVRSCGFYKHKARDIVLACQMLLRDYDGKVPDTMEKLLKLPGVGRKTANLLLGDIYHQEAYVCDTHCIRICGKLGLSHGKDPQKVEMQLRQVIPPEESSDFCHRIVLHGRAVCTARNPKCMECTLAPFCDFFTGLQNAGGEA